VLEYAEEVGLEVSTEPLSLEQLASADAVVLTSALRQTPVLTLDGRELGQAPDLQALLEAALVTGG
jgi:branched-subunit amino acid aminotransferase/4-amino-4-deoxychorismate lyase